MLQAEYRHVILHFKETAITSRSRMDAKDTYVIKLTDTDIPGRCGIGECALFRGLSAEDTAGYERMLAKACACPTDLPEISSIRFGFESALADLQTGGLQRLYDTPFTQSEKFITINGLIWMGDKNTMRKRIAQKIEQGFGCVKLKIGGISFDEETELLAGIRRNFSRLEIELRLDANGAFSTHDALDKLNRLASFDIHSIEQPIKPGQWEAMAELCEKSPIPIALDEELIGYTGMAQKIALLDMIKPSYIILKPSLCGGFAEADNWIAMAEERNIRWWATSALESNIGLNAIAQWVSTYDTQMPQGLGTGQLYKQNFSTPLKLEGEKMFCIDRNIDSTSLWEETNRMLI